MKLLFSFFMTLIIVGVMSCDKKKNTDPLFSLTPALLLSEGSPTKDEDPSLILASDNKLYLAWFSDRGNNPDIYITHIDTSMIWSPPVRVTFDPGGDFNPSLIQTPDGQFHLTWFRWTAPFLGNIWYNTSADGVTWDTTAEVKVTTTAGVDDWVPTLVPSADGSLLIYFVSDERDAINRTNEIYVTTKSAGSNTWSEPVPATGINSMTLHDHLPFAKRTGDSITLTWVRYDTSQALPWLNPKSSVWFSSSQNGLNWQAPHQLTTDTGSVVNLFPGIFGDSKEGWNFVWLSTRSGTPEVYEIPIDNADQYPSGIQKNALLTIEGMGNGYSHRISPTPSRGIYLGVWVQGPEGQQDIYYRFFER
ncbi:glycoside hydrolase [bacterium]|nr:glycoside hydrolase [bacterium]